VSLNPSVDILKGKTVNHISPKLLLLSTLLLSGCSVITYELRDELPESKQVATCDIAFTLSLQSEVNTNTFGDVEHADEERNSLKQDYIVSTLNTLDELGCAVTLAPNTAESNFSIVVSRELQLSALPQEFLTGLSLGIIPSWGTKYGQYKYTFTRNSGESYSYNIDQDNYNHLVLFPVFWVSYFTANEQDIYNDALINFIRSAP
jgi:hypothetical protein